VRKFKGLKAIALIAGGVGLNLLLASQAYAQSGDPECYRRCTTEVSYCKARLASTPQPFTTDPYACDSTTPTLRTTCGILCHTLKNP